MTLEDLKGLASAVEPLSAGAGDLHGSEAAAYNSLVSRFRERVTRAVNDLTLGQPHEPELTQELFLMARELPRIRRKAEAATRRELPVSGE